MHSNRYTILFVLGMTTIVALLLATMYTSLKDIHDRNEAIYNKKEIISAIFPNAASMGDNEIVSIFKEKVQQYVLDRDGNVVEGIQADKVNMAKEKKKDPENRQYPLYVYDGDEGKYYIVSVRGSGLWDEIWGSIAIKDDFQTVEGVAFGHKAETPGLGAEITDNGDWKAKFKGKKIYEPSKDQYLSVKKGGISQENKDIQVDAISGATVTSDGVSKMIRNGLDPYFAYFDHLKSSGKTGQLIK